MFQILLTNNCVLYVASQDQLWRNIPRNNLLLKFKVSTSHVTINQIFLKNSTWQNRAESSPLRRALLLSGKPHPAAADKSGRPSRRQSALLGRHWDLGGRIIASQAPASLPTWHPWFCWSLGAVLTEAKHYHLDGLYFWCQCRNVHGHGAEGSHSFSWWRGHKDAQLLCLVNTTFRGTSPVRTLTGGRQMMHDSSLWGPAQLALSKEVMGTLMKNYFLQTSPFQHSAGMLFHRLVPPPCCHNTSSLNAAPLCSDTGCHGPCLHRLFLFRSRTCQRTDFPTNGWIC